MNLILEGSQKKKRKKLYQSMSTKVYRGMSTKYYRRVGQQNFVGLCPPNYIGGLSIKLYQSISNKLYRRLTNEFSKKKSFVLKTDFHALKNACVRESGGLETWGKACRHSSRNVHTCT